MAAHTFELSPNWTRPRPPVTAITHETIELDQGFAADDRLVNKPRNLVAWILLPIAAATIGLAAYLGASPDSAAANRPATPATHTTMAALVQGEDRRVTTPVSLAD